MKISARHKRPATQTFSSQPMFRPAATAGRAVSNDFFFAAAPLIQRQEESTSTSQQEEPDPVVEGLKTTGERLLQIPAFKAWYEPKIDQLRLRLWEQQPSDAKAALIAFGGVNVALAGLVFALNPEIREMLSGTNIGAPLGWIPYSPIEGFRYTLPSPGSTRYGFGADFTFNPYIDALRESHPNIPLTGLTFGLESGYNAATGGFSLTGGRLGMEFLGGGLNVTGRTFTELSPYPQSIPGRFPGEPPSTLMQSVPGQPPLRTGPGFELTVSADLLRLFPGLRGVF